MQLVSLHSETIKFKLNSLNSKSYEYKEYFQQQEKQR